MAVEKRMQGNGGIIEYETNVLNTQRRSDSLRHRTPSKYKALVETKCGLRMQIDSKQCSK